MRSPSSTAGSAGAPVRLDAGDGEERFDAVAQRVVERPELDAEGAPDAVVAQDAAGPDRAELGLARLQAFRRVVGDRTGIVAQLGQDAIDRRADLLVVVALRRPRDVALAVGDLLALEQPDVARRVVAHVDRHPGPVRARALEDLAAPLEHPSDQVLP